MKKYIFNAFNLSSEFDLNKFANHFNISRKFRWEDTLRLSYSQLKYIIKDTHHKYVRLYSFGSIVFSNFTESDIATFMKYLNTHFNVKQPFPTRYEESYELRTDHEAKIEVSNDFATCDNELLGPIIDVISLILARSVAMERMENSISRLIDDVEEEIVLLEKGKLDIEDKKMAKLASKILGFKYSSISNIMLFDKPDITWEDISIDDFYYDMVELFELEDRYEQIKHKSEVLMDITEVFSTLGHERRSTRLEWAVIILIVIEIVLSLIDMALRGPH